MDEEHAKEASWVAQSVTGLSAYLYGIGCDVEEFKQAVAAIVEHVKKSAQT